MKDTIRKQLVLEDELQKHAECFVASMSKFPRRSAPWPPSSKTKPSSGLRTKPALPSVLRGVHEQLSPTLSALASLQKNNAIQRLVEETARYQETMRAALGPFEDLRRFGVFEKGLAL